MRSKGCRSRRWADRRTLRASAARPSARIVARFSNEGRAVFTGIVSDLGEVLETEERAEGLRRLVIGCGYDPATIAIGASIACSGPCLTVVERGRKANRDFFAVDGAAERLSVTTRSE